MEAAGPQCGAAKGAQWAERGCHGNGAELASREATLLPSAQPASLYSAGVWPRPSARPAGANRRGER